MNRDTNVRVEQILLRVLNHLIVSAANQTVETEPGRKLGERSQGGSAMDRREEARLHGRTGWRVGWRGGRAPRARAKSVLPAPSGGVPGIATAVTGPQSLPVPGVVMSGRQCVRPTGEVPRRRFPPGAVTARYKQAVKGGPHASASGTVSLRPWPQGCQQRQSSPAPRDERQNRSRSTKPRVVFGKVSSAAAATLRPVGTSSRQPAIRLRNVPRHGPRSIWTQPRSQRLP